MGVSGKVRRLRGGGKRVVAIEAYPRPDLEAYTRAIRLDFPILVKELSNILGAKLVAYVAGVSETRAVREWIEEGREPRDSTKERLQLTYRLARTIEAHDSAGVARAWLQGLNPQLDDRSPARMLREGDVHEVGPQLVAALRAFIIGG
jgi:hypothetical protein